MLNIFKVKVYFLVPSLLLFFLSGYLFIFVHFESIQDPRLILASLFSIIGLVLASPVGITDAIKKSMIMCIIFSVLGLYFFEAFIYYNKPISKNKVVKTVASALGNVYDQRTRIEVIRDLRDRNVFAFPSFEGGFFLNAPLNMSEGSIWPLSGHSNSMSVVCNETGQYYTSKSDRYGFLNPDKIYEKPIKIALLGDSFTQGHCTKNNLASNLRHKFIDIGNFGVADTGPLLQFGIFREYIEPLKPPLVVWLYYENDIDNLLSSYYQPILKSYLTTDKIQDLRELQPKLDAAIDLYVQNIIDGKIKRKRTIEDFILLRATRTEFGLQIKKPMQKQMRTHDHYMEMLPVLARILQSAKKSIHHWNGNLLFVYLPSSNQFSNGKYSVERGYLYRKNVLNLIKKLNIDYIDITEVFSQHNNPIKAYWWHETSHYNDVGHKIVSDQIIDHIIQ